MSTATMALAQRPDVGSGDRLGMMLCLAIILHGMLVLGVSFAPDPAPAPLYETLEVVLVTSNTDVTPEQARLLAPRNAQGGGDSDQFERPAAPLPAPLPGTTAEITAAPLAASEAAQPRQQDSADAPVAQFTPAPRDGESSAPVDTPATLTADTAPSATPQPGRPSARAELAPDPEDRMPRPEVAARPLPSAAQLITSSFALASINAELEQRLSDLAARPRQKFISASTREYRYAAYMEAWRAKVERIGNLNYPDEARRRHLAGSLILDVALNPDGSVREITVRTASGHPELDAAAVRIVELSAPFSPFPADIAKEVDVLHITRMWQFVDTGSFSTR